MKESELNLKILTGLERLSEVFKTLLWQKAKVHGFSPIQIQILLFISNHRQELCNVSYLAKEFNVSKPTISDAVRVLIDKGMLEKDFTPTDNRRYNLLLTSEGTNKLQDLSQYFTPVLDELKTMTEKDSIQLFKIVSKIIFGLNKKGIIQVQRTCFACRFYAGDRKGKHFCNLLGKNLLDKEIRLDCPEFENK